MAAITSSIRLTVPKIVSDLEFLGTFNLLVNLGHLPYVTLLQYNPFDRENCSSEYHYCRKIQSLSTLQSILWPKSPKIQNLMLCNL